MLYLSVFALRRLGVASASRTSTELYFVTLIYLSSVCEVATWTWIIDRSVGGKKKTPRCDVV